MRYILILLLLTSCGGDIVISGDFTVTHKIDLATEWFIDYCKDLYPTDEALQNQCVKDMVADFLDIVSGVK